MVLLDIGHGVIHSVPEQVVELPEQDRLPALRLADVHVVVRNSKELPHTRVGAPGWDECQVYTQVPGGNSLAKTYDPGLKFLNELFEVGVEV